MRTFVLMALALFLSCAPALAQAGKTTIGLGVGTGIGLTESLKDTTDSDLALQGHLTLGLAGGAWRARADQVQTDGRVRYPLRRLCTEDQSPQPWAAVRGVWEESGWASDLRLACFQFAMTMTPRRGVRFQP